MQYIIFTPFLSHGKKIDKFGKQFYVAARLGGLTSGYKK